MNGRNWPSQAGSTLIEVLVTIVILALGLLGLAGLQARLQFSEMESYQRAQALVLLNDMASRLASNRRNADQYVVASPVVPSGGCSAPAGTDRHSVDMREWCRALEGAAEAIGGASAGAMIGGRGCIEDIGGGGYRISVAWQGMSPLAEPPAGATCGAGAYDNANSSCTGDRCRRVLTSVVRLGVLN